MQDIDKAIEELNVLGPISDDPLYALSMMVAGPSGKVKALDKIFDMFPKIKGDPLETVKQAPKIVKDLQNKIDQTAGKINISFGANRDKLLQERADIQEMIKAVKKYQKDADNYFQNILTQPSTTKFSPKFGETVKEYIKIKDPKMINIGLAKNLDNANIAKALKQSDILDQMKDLNKINVLNKPKATFADRLKIKELRETLDYKSIDEALEALKKLD